MLKMNFLEKLIKDDFYKLAITITIQIQIFNIKKKGFDTVFSK